MFFSSYPLVSVIRSTKYNIMYSIEGKLYYIKLKKIN